jgi:protocatechuate 3,4-dioxygenase beta subunit
MNEAHPHDHHGRDLAEDLARLHLRLVQRRRALGWLATAAGVAVLGGCGGNDTAGSTATATGSGDTSGSSGSSGSCVALPQETSGPYPGDGTNDASGSTSDVLTASGIVRSDIRASFIDTTTVAQGVQVTLTLTVVDSSSSCAPLAGRAVYVWHCDRSGDYSLYTAAEESYLRGVQVTDANGQVTFTTIFPGCYSGRYPHIHFEVFSSLAEATTGRNAQLTSQLAMPAAACNAVYGHASGYDESVANYASVSIAGDMVFGDDTSAEIAAMTPAMSGSVAAGYVATATIGMST